MSENFKKFQSEDRQTNSNEFLAKIFIKQTCIIRKIFVENIERIQKLRKSKNFKNFLYMLLHEKDALINTCFEQ